MDRSSLLQHGNRYESGSSCSSDKASCQSTSRTCELRRPGGAGGSSGSVTGTSTITARTTVLRLEVRTRDTRGVTGVDDEREAAEERGTSLLGAEEGVDEAGGEAALGGDFASVLAGQIADLAGLGRGCVAHVQLAAVLRVEVAHGGGAVAVRGDGHGVDVPGEGAVLGLAGEVGDVDGEFDAFGCAHGGDGALDGAADERVEHEVWEGSDVGVGGLVGLRGCWAVDGRVACVGWEWADDGTL